MNEVGTICYDQYENEYVIIYINTKKNLIALKPSNSPNPWNNDWKVLDYNNFKALIKDKVWSLN